MSKLNYFELLDLSFDPREDDLEIIDKAITKKQHDWSLKSQFQDIYKTYLSLINDIKEVMLDFNKRKALADELSKERYSKVDQLLKTISLKGYITTAEYTNIIKKFSILVEETLKRRIMVPILEEHPKIKIEILDKSTLKVIDKYLHILNISDYSINDLYEFIETFYNQLPNKKHISNSKNLTTSELLEFANAIYKDTFKTIDKTPILTAKTELSGKCLNIFKSDLEKTKYDNYLHCKKFDYIFEEINKINFVSNKIDEFSFNELVDTGIRMGIDEKSIKKQIINYCSQKQILLNLNVENYISDIKLIQCITCGVYNLKTSRNCSFCGVDLYRKCPNCNHENEKTKIHCTKCNFDFDKTEYVLQLIQLSETQIENFEYLKAFRNLTKANKLWPNNKDIMTMLNLSLHHSKIVTKLSTEIRNLITSRYFYKAKLELNKLKSLVSTNSVSHLEEKINSSINYTNQMLTEALKQTNLDIKFKKLNEILTYCRDCEAAILELTQYKPPIPTSINYSASENHININWSKDNLPEDVSFILVKSIDRPVSSPNDGKIIYEGYENYYTDFSVKLHINYFYTLFTKRYSSISKDCISSELINIKYKSEDTKIKIKFKIKPKCNLIGKLKGIYIEIEPVKIIDILPTLLVVTQRGHQPLGKSDGKHIYTIDNDIYQKDSRIFVDLSNINDDEDLHFNLFFNDYKDKKYFEIQNTP